MTCSYAFASAGLRTEDFKSFSWRWASSSAAAVSARTTSGRASASDSGPACCALDFDWFHLGLVHLGLVLGLLDPCLADRGCLLGVGYLLRLGGFLVALAAAIRAFDSIAAA
jgi:hypothetical protein